MSDIPLRTFRRTRKHNSRQAAGYAPLIDEQQQERDQEMHSAVAAAASASAAARRNVAGFTRGARGKAGLSRYMDDEPGEEETLLGGREEETWLHFL